MIEELKRSLLESFDIEESFLIVGMKLKNHLRFQLAVFFEVDWKNLYLIPAAMFPSARRSILTYKHREISVSDFIYDIFSKPWIEFTGKSSANSPDERLPDCFPAPFFLFPLKVKQRIMSAVGIGGMTNPSEENLKMVAKIIEETAPILEKNLLIDRTIKRNQRLETIIGSGDSTYLVVDRGGYVSDYIPDHDNSLGFSQEEVARKPITHLLGNSEGIVRRIWKDVFRGNSCFTILINNSGNRKELATVSIKKALLKYTLQKEYYLLRIRSIEQDLAKRFSMSPDTGETCLHVKIKLCPENLICVKKLGKKVHYIGEGKFLVTAGEFMKERCNENPGCITEISTISYDSKVKQIR